MTRGSQDESTSAYFNVLPPGSEEAIFTGPTAGAHFEGTLPQDGDYRVRVYLYVPPPGAMRQPNTPSPSK